MGLGLGIYSRVFRHLARMGPDRMDFRAIDESGSFVIPIQGEVY